MEQKQRTLDTLVETIHAAQRIALIMHVSPDGDTCGSALALRCALLTLQKNVTVVCDNVIPKIYQDLDGVETVISPEKVKGVAYDLVLAVDVADCLRMGESVHVFTSAEKTAQADHHGTNPAYADINYLQSPLSATAVLVLEIIDALGVPLDLSMAKNLYVAVATDTGNFKQQNTDAQALVLASRCLETGLDPTEVVRRVFDLRPIEQLKLIARALESLALYEDGKIAIMRLDKRDFEETGALPEHTEGIINFGINTEGVQMACLLSCPIEKMRGSLRSLPPYNVAEVAKTLGGGGHAAAAGFTLEPPMEQAARQALQAMREELLRRI